MQSQMCDRVWTRKLVSIYSCVNSGEDENMWCLMRLKSVPGFPKDFQQTTMEHSESCSIDNMWQYIDGRQTSQQFFCVPFNHVALKFAHLSLADLSSGRCGYRWCCRGECSACPTCEDD